MTLFFYKFIYLIVYLYIYNYNYISLYNFFSSTCNTVLYKRFLIVFIRWDVSENTYIWRPSAVGWGKELMIQPLFPDIPNDVQNFLFVAAPSVMTPWILAPFFSNNVMAYNKHIKILLNLLFKAYKAYNM